MEPFGSHSKCGIPLSPLYSYLFPVAVIKRQYISSYAGSALCLTGVSRTVCEWTVKELFAISAGKNCS